MWHFFPRRPASVGPSARRSWGGGTVFFAALADAFFFPTGLLLSLRLFFYLVCVFTLLIVFDFVTLLIVFYVLSLLIVFDVFSWAMAWHRFIRFPFLFSQGTTNTANTVP